MYYFKHSTIVLILEAFLVYLFNVFHFILFVLTVTFYLLFYEHRLEINILGVL